MNNQAKLSVLAVSAVMVLSVCCVYVSDSTEGAEIPTDAVKWDGTSSTGWTGAGTADNPYIIDDASELAGLASQVNSGTSYSGQYFKLAVNLDISGHEWTPIGYYVSTSDLRLFYGTFDGDGKTIYGLQTSSQACAGLFGGLGYSTINNLTISNAQIEGSRYAAALSAYMTGVTVQDCVIKDSEVSCTGTYAGGFGGVVYGCDFIGSTVSGVTISSASYAAPYVGLLSSNSEIVGCHAEDNTVSGTTVGGLTGNTFENNTISKSYVNGLKVQNASMVGHIAGNPVSGLNLDDATYLGTFTGADSFVDDGSMPALVSATDFTGYQYYYDSLDEAVDSASEGIVTLIDGALFVGNHTVPQEVTFNFTGEITIAHGAVLTVNSKGSIPTGGQINIIGVLKLDYAGASPTDVGDKVSGAGYVMVDNVAYEPGTDTVDSDAEDTTWYDSAQSVFTLTNAIQLFGFASLVDSGVTFSGKTVQLGNDIDMDGIQWNPIGSRASGVAGHGFHGTFDGQGNTISNISVELNDGTAVGLFGFLNGGTVKNINVTGSSFTGSYTVGAIVGYANTSSTIQDCSVSGTQVSTTGESYAGGIVGVAYGSKIIGCDVRNTIITSESRMGGISGLLYSASVIELCSAEDVTLSGLYGAGLIGQFGLDCSTSKSYVDGLTIGRGAVVYPVIYNGNISDDTVTHQNLDAGFRFSDDGSRSALILVECSEGSYYYGSIDVYLKENPDTPSITLIDGAVIDNRNEQLVINKPLIITDARVEYGSSVLFQSADCLPTSGTLTVDGAIMIQTLPETVSFTLQGNGFIVTASGDIPVAYGLDFQPLEADISWMASTDSPVLDSAADLMGLELLVNHMGIDFNGTTLTLGANVDLDGIEWDPIGRGSYPSISSDTPFNGTFDGNGYIISNLSVDLPNESLVGFFGFVREGTLQNVHLRNVDVSGDSFVGGIVGWYGNANSTIYDSAGVLNGCTVDGIVNVAGNSTVGGIVGELIANASNCSVNASGVSRVGGTQDNVGGFAGYVQRHDVTSGSTEVVSVSSISVSGLSVRGSGEVGGVIGSVTSHISLTDCSVANSVISAESNDGEPYYYPGIGGLFGTIRGVETSVSDCSVERTTLVPNGQPAGYVTGSFMEDTIFDGVSYTSDCSGGNISEPEGTTMIVVEDDDQDYVPTHPNDDDDEFVPPVYVVDQSSGDSDDMVSIVACAAAAVVAALMAAFLILEYRKR